MLDKDNKKPSYKDLGYENCRVFWVSSGLSFVKKMDILYNTLNRTIEYPYNTLNRTNDLCDKEEINILIRALQNTKRRRNDVIDYKMNLLKKSRGNNVR